MKRNTAFLLLLGVIVLGVSWATHDQPSMDRPTGTSTSAATPTTPITPTFTPTPLPATSAATITPTPTATPLVWPPPPSTYSVYNQYGWEILKYELGLNGCGLVAAFSALDDLAYPIDDLEAAHRELVDLAFDNGFTETYGIQPSHYARTLRDFFADQSFGHLGTVIATQAKNGSDGLERIRKELHAGKVVIVDILVASEKVHGGTYPVGVNGPALPQERIRYIFAHYLRVLGFEDGGETIVLAETLHPNIFDNSDRVSVSRDDFIAAWENPEWRADYHPWYAEEVDYWMLVISPPEGIP